MHYGLHRLSVTKIRKTDMPGMYNDGGGLYVRVQSPLSKQYVFRYTYNSKRKTMSLGGVNTISLTDVREKAMGLREVVANGGDPKHEISKHKNVTFGMVADEVIEQHIEHVWKNNKSEVQWRRSLEVQCAELRGIPITQLGTDDVVKILKPLWTKTPESARRTRMRIERVFSRAKTMGWYKRENPAIWKNHLDNILVAKRPPKKKHASLPYTEIPAFIQNARGRKAISAKAMEMIVLTAVRISNGLQMKWKDIDFEKRVWKIPDNELKVSIENIVGQEEAGHIFPLTPRMLEILNNLSEARLGDYVFPSPHNNLKHLSNSSLKALQVRMGYPNITTHGFRATFKTFAMDHLDYDRQLSEFALAHKLENEVESAYWRSTQVEKRRALMNDWDKYCAGQYELKTRNL